MPNVNPTGSSPPPVSGSVKDPQQHDQAETVSYAPDPGLPEQQDVLGRVEVVEENHSSGLCNSGEEKTSDDDQQACARSRNREQVIKEIGISSTAFIGPGCRPQPAIEDELSEFYKELAQIDQQDTVEGHRENVSGFCAPPHTVEGHRENVSGFCAPPHTVEGHRENVSGFCAPPHTVEGHRENVSGFCAPPHTVEGHREGVTNSWTLSINPPAIKEKRNDRRNAYRPYPATWTQTDYRNTPQWRPQSHWSNPYSYVNQWQLPPPNLRFCPPPRLGNPTFLAYSQPQGHQCSQLKNSSIQLGPDVRLTSSPSPASYTPYEVCERRHYEEQNYQDLDQHQHSDGPSSLVLILMRGVPGSGKSTLARQISSSGPSGLILSTDDYFQQKDGYHFEPTLLGAAHDWNQNRAEKAMLDGRTPVIIDNTNVQAWEMKPYVTVALETGYKVEFVEPDSSWKRDPVELEKRNHHGVSRETIANMLDRFEHPISVDIVMNSREPSSKRKQRGSRPYRRRRRR